MVLMFVTCIFVLHRVYIGTGEIAASTRVALSAIESQVAVAEILLSILLTGEQNPQLLVLWCPLASLNK
jgi:hypothetical protein